MKSTENLKKYRSMKVEDLQSELKNQEKDNIINILKIKSGKESNTSIAKKNRRSIAIINTILNEKLYGVNDGK